MSFANTKRRSIRGTGKPAANRASSLAARSVAQAVDPGSSQDRNL